MGKRDQEKKELPKWQSPKYARMVFYGILGLVAVAFVIMHFVNDARSLPLSQFNEYLSDKRVTEAEFDRDGHALEVKLSGEDSTHTVNYPAGAEGQLFEDLKDAGVDFKTEGTSLLSVVGALATAAFWIFLLIFALNVINSLQKLVQKGELEAAEVERPTTTLADVQGIDEIVARANEIVDIMGNPERYRKLGARPPKGMILYGPPGTGKTLLARAIAGEAKVPFFKVAAARLMDKWLGSSAGRIEKLYERARSHGSAIVFIDEIDAIGGSRTGRARGGADDERNAALTQLLNELDGFEKSNVFTIVATNRLDILDEALTRAGRFDIQLFVPPPDVKGREAILKLHTTKLPLADDVDLSQLARETTGSVGADLEALANEAALTAGRAGADVITHEHFGEALATIENGPQRKGVTVSEAVRRTTAFHEAGHALAALFQEEMDNPVRVTIVPRGQSGGHTRVAPEEDRQYMSKQEAKARLVWMMGGRAAEKIHCGFDDFTSGISGDLKQATQLAERMVCEWGMGSYNTSIPLETWRECQPYAKNVEQQIEKLLDDAETAAIDLLLQHITALEMLIDQLLSQETIQGSALLRYSKTAPLEGRDLEEVREQYQEVITSVRTERAPINNGNGRPDSLTV